MLLWRARYNMCVVVAQLHVGSCTAGRLVPPPRFLGTSPAPRFWYLDFTYGMYMYSTYNTCFTCPIYSIHPFKILLYLPT